MKMEWIALGNGTKIGLTLTEAIVQLTGKEGGKGATRVKAAVQNVIFVRKEEEGD